jgi:hypothetical protein
MTFGYSMQQTDFDSAISRQSWEWLVDLAPRLDIIIEMVDEHQAPLFPAGPTPEAVEFRTMLTSREPTIALAMSDVLESRKPVFVSVENLQAVCCSLASGGVLFVARPNVESVEECRQDLEAIAHWLTGAIDATLAQTSAISVEPYRIVSFRRILREATARGSARKVIGAFVEALSVWDDVRARCYVAGANGGFVPYGAALSAPPSTHDRLDDVVSPAHGRIVRLSRSEIEGLGIVPEPGDTLMLRILAGDIAWLLVFSGMIDDREQVRLRVYSDILRESLHDTATMATSRLVAEVSRPQRPTNEPPESSGQIALDQLMDAVNATRGGLALTAGGRPALVVGLTDLLAEPDQAEGNRLVVRSSDGDSVMIVVCEREQSPFTALDREMILAGMAVVHRWMQTGLQRSSDGERRRRFRPIDSVFDQLADNAIATGRQASVVVVSVDEAAGRGGVLAASVGKIRAQLRAGDFAGVLSEREIAVLLCGASSDHAALVSARLMKMLKSGDSTGAFLNSAIGMTTRSPESSFHGSLVGAARARATRR